MTENPYWLARDIRGIGFKTADAIAMKLGMAQEAPQRVRAGISYALQEAMDEGHCGLPVEDLVKLAVTLLDVADGTVRSALDAELAGSDVVSDRIDGRPCVFLRRLHLAERGVAERLLALARGAPRCPAKRMAEQTGIEARTIHRLLETDPKNGDFRRKDDIREARDLFIGPLRCASDAPAPARQARI